MAEGATRLFHRPGDFDPREALDLIAHPHVLVVLHADAALGAGTYFAHVILEAPQRFQLPLVDHHALAQHANGIVALDCAFRDQTARHDAELAGAEYIAYLRDAQDGLLDLRGEHAAHHRLNVIDGLVDDAEIAHIHAQLLDRFARARIGTHIEADNHRLGGGGQLNIRGRAAADAAGDDLDRDFRGGKLGQRLAQGLLAALHVGLQQYHDDSRLAGL